LWAIFTSTPCPVSRGNEKEILCALVDITRNKQAEDERRAMADRVEHMQRLESLGILAGGIAHDFNNILSAIIGYAQLAERLVTRESEVHALMAEINRAGTRAAELTQQILAFSRRQEHTHKEVWPHDIIREVTQLLKGSLPSTIEIVLDLDHDCGPVWADPTALHQVLMNLCTNAYQAMGEKGGTLRITLEHAEIPYDDARRMEIQPGTCVMISVTDTGCGMDEDTIKRVFDPYFTTREGGRGTGLGLATVHGIVSGHGGAVMVDSTPGEGSTFAVFLPRHLSADAPAQAGYDATPEIIENAAEQPDVDAAARILFVDDEDMIVRLAVNCLEREGHHVTAFTDSNEALDAFRKTPDAFDLVITDQTMPRLTGVELAAAIHELRPDLPIVLCTGYSESLRPDTIEEFGIARYLQKPVSISTLQEAVRDIPRDRPHKDLAAE
jgi:nitrogen-specific signal transduction histidine kinase/CheY-like chemotaxis protein